MSELISGKEALIALANGENLQARDAHEWKDVTWDMPLSMFNMPIIVFRIKPQTITINGVDVDKPKSIFTVDSRALDIRFNTEEERNRFLNALHNRAF